MAIILYFKCTNCGKEFGVNPEDPKVPATIPKDFEKSIFDDMRCLPITDSQITHICDNHTFGAAEFTHGKRVPDKNEV